MVQETRSTLYHPTLMPEAGAIPGDPSALREAARMLETNSRLGEDVVDDIRSARSLALSGWSAPSAQAFEARTSEAQSAAVALIDTGAGAAPPLLAYAEALEAAQKSFAEASDDAASASEDASSAEQGSRAEREAEADVDRAERAMKAARQAALEANQRAAQQIAALAPGGAAASAGFGAVPSFEGIPSLQPIGAFGEDQSVLSTVLKLLGLGNSAFGAWAGGLMARAWALERALSTATNPAVRANAGRRLLSAGGLARSPLVRIGARASLIAGPVLDVAVDRSEGRGWISTIGHTAAKFGGGLLGGAGGTAVCLGETVSTAGIGVVACPVLIGGGVWGGAELTGGAYDMAEDLASGDPPPNRPRESGIPPLRPIGEFLDQTVPPLRPISELRP